MAKDDQDIFANGNAPAEDGAGNRAEPDSAGFDDLFGGGEQTRELLETASGAPVEHKDYVADLEKELKSYENGSGKMAKLRIPLMYAALGAMAIMLVLILWNPVPKTSSAQSGNNPAPKRVTREALPDIAENETELAASAEQAVEEDAETDQPAEIEMPVSWQLAHESFVGGDYDQALKIYEKLRERLKPGDTDNLFRDLIDLQVALCHYYMDDADKVSKLFTNALQSRSPAIRAMSNYYLAFIDFKNENFLSAREHAYRSLALFHTLKDHFPAVIERDCYMLIGNALTRETISLSNSNTELPGQSWAEYMTPYHLPAMDKKGIEELLQKGIESMADAAMGPAIRERRESLGGGTFSAIALDCPVDEFIARYANYQGYGVSWHKTAEQFTNRPINLYLPKTIEQKIPEYAAGSAGLIVRSDTNNLTVYNPRTYVSLAFHKRMMVNESMAVWRHFLHRYPQDPRVANAHFGLAAVYSAGGQENVAIGEYKLVASRYSDSELAPYALLYSSRIKTDMKDYAGAREDLSNIVLQYPKARISDQAYLYLAQATMKSGIYGEAADLFAKVYNLNITRRAKARAAYGAAICNYETGQFGSAEAWFERCEKFYNDDPEIDKGELYYTLAKTKFALGKYEDATTAFRLALTGNLDRKQYANVILSWAQTMMSHGDYAEALNILAAPNEEDLTLEQSCEILKAQARIYREIDLPRRSAMLLNQKIEFLANAELRGELLVELARSYVAAGDTDRAEQEYLAALDDLSEGKYKLETTLELADLCIDTGRDEQAVDICSKLLATPLDQRNRKTALSILGTAYKNQKQYDKAAMAFAGVYNPANN
ncbi:tol-pal system protein YbgF [Anaerohalosphaera lusitana]|uniref:Tol-pal system protein YbgF n=1 Tax=Anaerohalosphaera lusitana TaxID=1936003 RepID=A0A1U9NGN9_9BACT|nr:tetratricopeptide repeat protein [Anaerohalosphaera lusitana]AQT66927.1 tol-pal system protein YbgF [Anaerohalosphaera lusitana]